MIYYSLITSQPNPGSEYFPEQSGMRYFLGRKPCEVFSGRFSKKIIILKCIASNCPQTIQGKSFLNIADSIIFKKKRKLKRFTSLHKSRDTKIGGNI